MSLKKLPDNDSLAGKEIIGLYPTASEEQIKLWANQYGFANAGSFGRSVRVCYGVRRGRVDIPIETIRKPIITRHQGTNVPLKLQTKQGIQTIAVIGDTHNPFQDEQALAVVERFLGELKPNYLIYNGDISDFYQVSKFDKNPARIANLQSDLDNTKDMFARHRRLLPDTEMILTYGNHEYRWQKFLWSAMPAAASLDCLTVEKLYDLDEYGIRHIDYEQGLMINGVFLILHGDIASIHSGYTAKRMFEKHGGCGVCGHCHRGGSFYKRDRFGTWGWWEGFCLCRLDPDWIQNPNWVQGLNLVHFTERARFHTEQIPILGNTFMYGGKLYGAGE